MGNIHEAIDRFGTRTPRQKVLIVGGVILAIIAIILFVFWLGGKFRDWQFGDYMEARDAAIQRAEAYEKNAREIQAQAQKHIDNEKKLELDNDRLRKQNEATAELLIKNDAAIAGNAEKFVQLQKQREDKQNEIENASDADNIRGLCDDAKRAGLTLSFCG